MRDLSQVVVGLANRIKQHLNRLIKINNFAEEQKVEG